ncbi:Nonheme chloroperoxidase EC 111110 [Bradyrhizobium sp.]|uniref:alpha/beta fold hydrolase n=1 Tax=Bradyrhizobium sp. TaxID=376 RepID=UPI0007C18D62|nr:alpha/beta hydrolase [Bradyrhizobium sp.]CUT12153.1 Nonheme chloroperoxidase EC 111110 [Bradyrhizobium sp.]
MPIITTKDDVEIFYKDWGSGQPIVFSHGWPLSADDWDAQMMFFVTRGYRVIAHDRRGHGRSSQVADGHDMDHYADDLAAVTAHLDLKNAIHVGHSTGGGEVVHYIARHGESRVAKAAILSAVPPLMLKTEVAQQIGPLLGHAKRDVAAARMAHQIDRRGFDLLDESDHVGDVLGHLVVVADGIPMLGKEMPQADRDHAMRFRQRTEH